MSETKTITFVHSPDTDDVFMAWALATGRLDTGDRRYETHADDIEVLNREALQAKWDVSAISFGVYPHIHEEYALLTSGGSIGDGYGPVVVAKEALGVADLAGRTVAIPGKLTSAYLALRLAAPDFEPLELPFHEVADAVLDGRAAAGLLIHEKQITYADAGLSKVVDLGAWWMEEEGLPLPLGGNAIRRSLDPELQKLVAADLQRSIVVALEHRDEALRWACERVGNIEFERGQKYIDMYVNQDTVEMPPRVRRGIERLFERGAAIGAVDPVDLHFV